MIPADFKGTAVKLTDTDISKIGWELGVGEDEIHAVLDVETTGAGFDRAGRPRILFEPAQFHARLRGVELERARAAGLAVGAWKDVKYGLEAQQYPKLFDAMKINRKAALLSTSWGLGQVMGFNHALAGYTDVESFVADMCVSEAAQLRAMTNFIKAKQLTNALRTHNWAEFAKGYNGAGYRKNNYDKRLAAAHVKWQKIKDTPWSPKTATLETIVNSPISLSEIPSKTITAVEPEIITAAPADNPPSVQYNWANISAALSGLFRGK